MLKIAAQGEITIRKIVSVPKGCSPLALESGQFVIGHSETGHHHVLDRVKGCKVSVLDNPPEGMRILYAILENPTLLKHQRPFDTHAPIELDPGVYEFRIAREYDPYGELARQQAD